MSSSDAAVVEEVAGEKAAADKAVVEKTAAEMNVHVRYFAAAADAAGCEDEMILVNAGSTLGELKAELTRRYGPDMEQVVRTGSFLVDKVVRRDLDWPVSSQVDVLPPFAGG